MAARRTTLLRRSVVAAAALFALWSVVVFVSGGFSVLFGSTRVSSRDPLRPFLAAAALIITRVLLGDWRQISSDAMSLVPPVLRPAVLTVLSSCRDLLNQISPARFAGILVVATIGTGVIAGSAAASFTDSYAYVSQAELWIRGDLHLYQPESNVVPWPDGQWTFAPPGYRPSLDGASVVSTYAPGFPLLLALFKWLGSQWAMRLVVPLCGGLLVGATFLIGRRLGSDQIGAGAAWLMATSPAMLFMLMWPMTDVPAAAFWTVAIYACLLDSLAGVGAAGAAAAIAILIRPNLVYVGALMLAWLLWRDIRAGRRWLSIPRAAAFGMPLAVACLFVAVLNQKLYGSPTTSGYRDLGALFSWTHVLPNLAYVTWLWQSHTPVAVIGLVTLLVPFSRLTKGRRSLPGRGLLCIVAIGVLCCYLPYEVFDAWWYLRFLLPCLPAIFITVAWFAASSPQRWLNTSRALLFAIGVFGVWFARGHSVFVLGGDQDRAVWVAQSVRDATEPTSVIISSLYAGSVRYYGGRMTMRYDFLDADWLDRSVAWLQARHLHPYFLLSDGEREAFTARFGARNALGSLPMDPILVFPGIGGIGLYDPLQLHPTPRVVPQLPHHFWSNPLPVSPPRIKF